MKRVWCSAVLLVTAALVSVGSGVWVRTYTRQMADRTAACAAAYAAGDTDAALTAMAEITDAWDTFSHRAALLVEPEQLAPIEAAVSTLPPLLAAESPEGRALLAFLETHLHDLAAGQLPG